ncbi:MAG: hypothetical protein KF833_01145 [Verrucomicrobiae bacterium]|nr:hypothetical protein [Verrucomicrobiae bacterium]
MSQPDPLRKSARMPRAPNDLIVPTPRTSAPAALLAALTAALTLAATSPLPGPADRAREEQRLLDRLASEGTNAPALFALADLCHDIGVDGDKKAVLRAESYLRQLLSLEPDHAQALALLGSVYTLKGRDAFWPPTQLRLVREGNAFMDQAVELAPDDIATRKIRALNNAHMPDFLGRAEIVRADLDWLWTRIEAGPVPLGVSARQQVGLHLGRRLKRESRPDDARRVWETARDFAPDSPDASEINAELARLR